MAWDIGAFEYVSAGGLTATPTAESTTVSDTPTGALALVATPSEPVTVTDTPVGAIELLAVPTPDTATVSDSGEGALGSWHRSVEEPVTATDTPTPVLDLAHAASEPVTVSDTPVGAIELLGTASEPVTVSDTVEDVALVDLGADLVQSVEEPATVADTVTDRYLGSWHATATEPVTVTDTGEGALGSWHVTATEPVTVTDEGEGVLFEPGSNLTANPEEPVTVTDALTGYRLYRPVFVYDTPYAALSLVATPSESVVVTDERMPVLGTELEGTAFDSITVTETTGNELSTVIIVTDTATGSLAEIAPSQLVEDPVTVSDTPTPDLGANNLQGTPTADSVRVTDSGTGRLGSWYATATEPATVTDTVTEAELFVAEDPLARRVSEPVTVTETGRGFLTSPAVVSDILRVPYERRMWRIEHEARTRVVPYERRVWRIRRRTQR